ncbi:hypothetical protein [Croceivirga radicis]|uniref:hypothetical protein n=1 Tax=Croceivirga radicis TaxID=1929488 RepID=UPI000255AD98|nr:hypothetical protein [Croceivirga radicis]
MNNHVAILTGDIINSRSIATQDWLTQLKAILILYGDTPKQWEIYRGDSFQLEVTPLKALETAILIKAALKQHKNLDVRISIGIGPKEYNAEKITESNGVAFIRSGEAFHEMKKQTLIINTAQPKLNETLNLMLKLGLLTMDNWQPATAQTVMVALTNPLAQQKDLAKQLGKSQSTISEALLRAGFDEISQLLAYYAKNITNNDTFTT